MGPRHSLFEQSWAPARQRHGTVNADGFGVGWYVDREAPVRYRRAQPIWTDAPFASLAPPIATRRALAALPAAGARVFPGEAAAPPLPPRPGGFSHHRRPPRLAAPPQGALGGA